MRDIYRDIFSYHTSPLVYQRRKSIKRRLYGRNVFTRFYSLLLNLLKQLSSSMGRKEIMTTQIRDRVLVVINSRNQYESLKFLQGQKGFVLTSLDCGIKVDDLPNISWRSGMRIHYIFQYFSYLFSVLLTNPLMFSRSFSILMEGVGLYERYACELSKNKPKAIILSNDHIYSYRAIMHAANTNNIPTIFIQHASVTDDFPPLKFTYALLDGVASKKQYQKRGRKIESEIRYIGVPKFDKYVSMINSSRKMMNIGIAYGARDNLKDVNSCIMTLINNFPDVNITARPHPSDQRYLNIEHPRYSTSNSRIENGYEFLSSQDVLISGDSAIHLEATLMNVLSIYYRFTPIPNEYDLYGYVQNGMIKEAVSLEEIVSILNKEEKSESIDVRNKARDYYYPKLNSKYYGNCEQLALDRLYEVLRLNDV